MSRFLLLILAALSLNVWADPNQIVRGRLTYYGADFSPTMAASDLKPLLNRILAARHCYVKNQNDSFGSCERGSQSYQHSAVGYSQARIIMFGELFKQEDASGTYVTEVYCRNKVYYREPRQISSMSNVVNIEHTWPQSKFSSRFDKELQKSDMHHLFPSDSKANSVRANHEFGEAGQAGHMGADLCAPSDIDGRHGDYVFTPPSEHRGNVARALFYFSTRYEMPISADEERVLRAWHQADPVDAEERQRNNLIAKHQLSRNPFVDFPDLVSRIRDF